MTYSKRRFLKTAAMGVLGMKLLPNQLYAFSSSIYTGPDKTQGAHMNTLIPHTGLDPIPGRQLNVVAPGSGLARMVPVIPGCVSAIG